VSAWTCWSIRAHQLRRGHLIVKFERLSDAALPVRVTAIRRHPRLSKGFRIVSGVDANGHRVSVTTPGGPKAGIILIRCEVV
jgi:hypothetical protein